MVALSVFDACVVSAWLNEPKADVTARVKRGLCEQFDNAMELVRLRLEDDASEQRAFWKERAKRLGWPVKVANTKPIVDDTSRPLVPSGIAELLVGDDQARIGRTQWSHVRHGREIAWYGLRQAITRCCFRPARKATPDLRLVQPD